MDIRNTRNKGMDIRNEPTNGAFASLNIKFLNLNHKIDDCKPKLNVHLKDIFEHLYIFLFLSQLCFYKSIGSESPAERECNKVHQLDGSHHTTGMSTNTLIEFSNLHQST